MQAYLDGRDVEWRRVYGGDWFLCEDREMFQWDKYDFRIKPKPREMWLVDVTGCLSDRRAFIETACPEVEGAVKYREVLNDE